MGILIALVVTVLLVVPWTVEALQFSVVHKYAHLEGSPLNRGGRGVTPEYFATLKEHHRRRRLIAAIDFPLGGNADPNSIALYYTQISLGTPPQQFYVQVDTGSDVLWVDCAPCQGCPPSSTIPGVTVQQYDPALSSTDTVLQCSATDCGAASDSTTAQCDSNGACAYVVQYGDGSNTTGYIINDVLTFEQGTGTTTANVYFGCGTTLSGFDQPAGAVDGLMGFGRAAVAVPTQLASQGVADKVFAHCLQGDSQIGGGTFVIGNITELGIVYTPLVTTGQSLYNVGMQNIAVNGTNITTPASFEISTTNAGVIMDSGTTLANLADPAFTSFLAAITSAAPVPVVMIQDGTSCWEFSGDVATAFPPVTLFFDGGVVMNLAPTNYLVPTNDSTGTLYQCMGWSDGTISDSLSITIWGDIVLKDQLVVYDNDLLRIGWTPFNCSQPISVGS